ncbi:MAG: hypothetical protein J6V24_03400 [Clostridia bacterium]|nr:hypothetical protein [Clostridia bacterium]
MITIRRLTEKDAPYFAAEECLQGWHSTPDKLLGRMRDYREGKCVPLVAELDGVPAGYVNVYHDCGFAYTPYAGTGYPDPGQRKGA